MRNPDLQSLVLVGPPRAGKDTLASGVDSPEFARWADQVIRPQRWATRPYHSNEEGSEWMHKSHEEFEEGIANGTISPYWTRSLDIGEKPEHYGFAAIDPEDDRLRIYSANYPIFEKPEEGMRITLAKAMVAEVTAAPKILHQRLAEIEKEMAPQERAARARKINQPAPQIYRPGLRISTTGLRPEQGRELFRNLVKDILVGWVPLGYTVDDPSDLETPAISKPNPGPHTDRKPLG